MSERADLWHHLEVLRWMIIRSLVCVVIFFIVAFTFKDFVFENIVFMPINKEFFIFRFFDYLANLTGIEQIKANIEQFNLINTDLSFQLFTHISVSFYIGFVFSIPYILCEIWRFIKPALRANEKKIIIRSSVATCVLFYLGVLFAWLIILPFAVNFLYSYQVSSEVKNLISLNSYIDSFETIILSTGFIFLMPIFIICLGKIGIVTSDFLKNKRKYAFLVVLILSAIITPTTDAFTMLIVAMPVQALYEISIFMVKRNEKRG